MNSPRTKLLIIIAVGVAYVVPVEAQTLKKEPDATQLSCGQKVLVENNTCPADQILEVTGSCLNTTPTIDMVRTPRGTQYNLYQASQTPLTTMERPPSTPGLSRADDESHGTDRVQGPLQKDMDGGAAISFCVVGSV